MIDSGSALLMLRKWAEEHTPLLFTFTSLDAGFNIGGTISSASPEECDVRSSKGDATLRFRIDDPDCKFEFTDRRSLAGGEPDEGKGELGALLIFFPVRFSLEAVRLTKQEPRPSLRVMALHDSEIKGD